MKRLLAAVALIGVVGLSACGDGQSPFSDIITYRYKFAEQRQPDRYHLDVMRGSLSQPCANQIEDIMRLEQIAFMAQRGGINSMINICHSRFTVDVAAVRSSGSLTAEAEFEFEALPATSDRRVVVVGNLGASGDTFPNPSKIQIQTDGAALVGQKTTDGFAEISFSASGPIYRCESEAGEDFWEDHILDPETDTFFEFTLTSYDAGNRRATAEFQCLARNTTDPTDKRLLLVMIGSIIMPTEN